MTETVDIRQGDCREVMRAMPDNSVDAIVTDPPYGLTANKRGGTGEASLNLNSPAGRSRISTGGGFMGQQWDAAVPGVEFWVEALRVAKPGAHLLAFGGTRTYHRLACAIEDAGWEIRDCVFYAYGSGFPKSHNISVAIDKRGGYPHLAAEIGKVIKESRTMRGLTVGECDKMFCGGTTNWSWFEGRPAGQRAPTPSTFSAIVEAWPELQRLSKMVDEAEREVVGQRTTGIGTGGGATPIMGDGNRDITAPATDAAKQWDGWGTALKPAVEPIILARKPLDKCTVAENVLRHGTGGLNVDGCRVGTDDGTRNRPPSKPTSDTYAQDSWTQNPENRKPFNASGQGRWPANLIHDGSDEVVGLFPQTGASSKRTSTYGEFSGQESVTMGHDDAGGSAARFFKGCPPDDARRIIYTAKASKRDRDEGCEGLEQREAGIKNDSGRGFSESDPMAKILRRNHHPTVKPTSLMRYLCRLITPPGGVVLDPFCGSGSTGKGAILEGFRFIGIEREPEYVEIARKRVAYCVEQEQSQKDEPLSLFDGQ